MLLSCAITTHDVHGVLWHMRVPADVPVPEEELAAEVGLLDDVVVGHHQLAGRAGCEPHHGQVLEELAPQRARAHQEHAQRLQPPLHARPEHRDLPVVAAPLRTTPRTSVLLPFQRHLSTCTFSFTCRWSMRYAWYMACRWCSQQLARPHSVEHCRHA